MGFYRRLRVGVRKHNHSTLAFVLLSPKVAKMIDPELTIQETPFHPGVEREYKVKSLSLAAYDVGLNLVTLWAWTPENVDFYWVPTDIDEIGMVARIVSHEYLHAIIAQLEGPEATLGYDCIWNLFLGELKS